METNLSTEKPDKQTDRPDLLKISEAAEGIPGVNAPAVVIPDDDQKGERP